MELRWQRYSPPWGPPTSPLKLPATDFLIANRILEAHLTPSKSISAPRLIANNSGSFWNALLRNRDVRNHYGCMTLARRKGKRIGCGPGQGKNTSGENAEIHRADGGDKQRDAQSGRNPCRRVLLRRLPEIHRHDYSQIVIRAHNT